MYIHKRVKSKKTALMNQFQIIFDAIIAVISPESK